MSLRGSLVTAAILLAPATAWADQEITLAHVPATIQIADEWTSEVDDQGRLTITDDEGYFMIVVMYVDDRCSGWLDHMRSEHETSPSDAEVPFGWTGIQYVDSETEMGTFCREFDYQGTRDIAIVISELVMIPFIAGEVSEGIDALLGVEAAVWTDPDDPDDPVATYVPEPEPEPEPESEPERVDAPKRDVVAAIRPRAFEFGAARLSDTADDGWGLAVSVAKLPVRKTLPTWGYRGTFEATSAGIAGNFAVGAGLSLRFINLMAIAGVGGAQHDVAVAPHLGAQLDLLLPFADDKGVFGTGMLAARGDGSIARVDVRLLAAPDQRRAFTLGVAWEKQLAEQIWAITLGTFTLPQLH